ncbi:MAG: DNA alkylation repair protein [Chloroflexota bacterium]|nr:DNA alkylation repair protein [Chloroflexota bacterium]
MNQALKDLFNEQSVTGLAAAIQKEYPAFDSETFLARIFDAEWKARELKERMRHITTVLHDFLPSDYRTALDVLRRAAPLLTDYGFVRMVFPDFVEVYGLDDWEASIPALEAFTPLASAEFAIRPFIARYTERTMAQMFEWAQHEDPHVRRLASEGCRPRLPWAMALPAFKADPSPILPILERLKQDESESVRRSVANNLNDISKDNPDVTIRVLQRWQADGAEEIRRITSHALRTLLKKGHPEALEILGYPSDPAIRVHNLTVEPDAVSMGGKVAFSFEIESRSDRPQNLMVDYVVHFMKANGRLAPKVFKLTKKTIRPGQVLRITKDFTFAPITTRKYYPGEHAIEPKVNGKSLGRVGFVLVQE